MAPQIDPSKRLEKLFARRKCWMLADLAATMGYALISVRRQLKRIGYFRSFSNNGKWYTLRSLPRFNREGIWHHRGVGFSKHGHLTATIIHLVERSPTGLSARELAQKLQHPCHAVLTQMHNHAELDRLKLGGEFRYLSLDAETSRRQREGLAAQEAPQSSMPLSTQAAVHVLVEYIKDPGQSFEQLAQQVRQLGHGNIMAASISAFFEEHGLKKTPDTSDCDH